MFWSDLNSGDCILLFGHSWLPLYLSSIYHVRGYTGRPYCPKIFIRHAHPLVQQTRPIKVATVVSLLKESLYVRKIGGCLRPDHRKNYSKQYLMLMSTTIFLTEPFASWRHDVEAFSFIRMLSRCSTVVHNE